MAARSVFKLLTKTCSCSLNATCPSSFSTVTPENTIQKHTRSCSCSRGPYKSTKDLFFQLRTVSRSLINLREPHYKDEEYEIYETEEHIISRNKFPPATDLKLRDPAKEFKDNVKIEPELNEEGNPIYELAEGSRTQENFYDVNYYMRKIEIEKAKRLFVDLQPSNLKPFGSSHKMYQPSEIPKKTFRIVYPALTPLGSTEHTKKKKVDNIQYKDFSMYVKPEQPQYEKQRNIAVDNSKENEPSKMKYSTLPSKSKQKCRPHTKLSSTLARKSSTTITKNRVHDRKQKGDGILGGQIKVVDQLSKGMSGYHKLSSGQYLTRTITSKEALIERLRNNLSESKRKYNTQSKTENVTSDDYVTVKLGQLQEECRKAKKCKPKKISFGRLPKLITPDCPCYDDAPLKEGKPLHRLKKRFDYKDPERPCPKTVCDTPRADADYKIKTKKLPVIHAADCPCEEIEMTDLIIKRLPKNKIPEPPRVCPCVAEECCLPRADGTIVVEKKALPKLEPKECACVEEIQLKSVPLKKLNPLPIKEPERVCKVEVCDAVLRADHGLKVEKKALPVLKGECACVEPPPMDEGEPLKRLKKIKYVEKPRECKVEKCEETARADSKLKVEKKKLRKFVPQNCPCIEPEKPTRSVKLKKLEAKFIPQEKERVCFREICLPRADEGMVVKPKQLPVLEPKTCPCVEVEMIDTPPLKKLIPKPVEEPPKICPVIECAKLVPRSDANLKVKAKTLPVLPAGNCPCVEAPLPLDAKPLAKLKKKPVTVRRPCVIKLKECTERADEHLKVKIKKLPKLEAPDCPCKEPPPPDSGKPFRRLRRVHVPEPPRICKKDICDEIPRADEDDWLYWKRVEVKSAEGEPTVRKKNTRSFSTASRRFYSTRMRPEQDLFNLQYDVPRLPPSTFKKQAYNVIIDIKPSAPLILTQKQLDLTKNDSMETMLTRKTITRSKSEPVDGVTFVIFKSNTLGASKPLQEGSSEASLFNTMHRYISTCSTLCEASREEPHLQPRNPIIPERERFITPYPSDDEIEGTARRGKKYERTRKGDILEDRSDTSLYCKEEAEDRKKPLEEKEKEKGEVICDKTEKQSFWERIVNYFKARPNCPSPEEFRKLRLKEAAEKAAHAAGLCLYDPKELLMKNQKEMPKVITVDSVKEECAK